jgi:hypothetical protein
VILEVSAIKQDGTIIFKEEKEYKNIGLSKDGKPMSAAWVISSYSEDMSTAFKPLEIKKETFKVSLPSDIGSKFQIYAKIYSFHGLPTEFGKPADKVLVMQLSERVKP